MHLSLGNTSRGLLAAAVVADGGAFLSAFNGTTTYHEALGVLFGSLIMLAGALIDPGSKPAKA